MPHTAIWCLIWCMLLLLPILLISLLVLLDVTVRWHAMWCLWDEIVGVRGRLLLLLGADEAECPVGEVEAAEDDDCGEDLFHQSISDTVVIIRSVSIHFLAFASERL